MLASRLRKTEVTLALQKTDHTGLATQGLVSPRIAITVASALMSSRKESCHLLRGAGADLTRREQRTRCASRLAGEGLWMHRFRHWSNRFDSCRM